MPSERDELGFALPDEPEARREADRCSRLHAERSAAHKQLWDDYLVQNQNLKKTAKLKKMIRNGIPMNCRAQLWAATSGAQSKLRNNNGVYQMLLRDAAAAPRSEALKQIELDVPRTFSEHPLFDTNAEKRTELQRVLTAYSVRNKSVGYCQSMNYIAAFFLLLMPEEQAFWLLTTVIEDILPPNYYSTTMQGVHADQRVFESLLETKFPAFHAHYKRLKVELSLATTSWFVCLYINVLPTEACLRVLDALFNEGSKILFRVGLALIYIYEELLLKITNSGVLFTTLQTLPARHFDADRLMHVAFHTIGSLSLKSIHKFRVVHNKAVAIEIAAMQATRAAAAREVEEEERARTQTAAAGDI